MTDQERQAVVDDEHLRLLTLFHYISGGMTIAFSLLFMLWLAFMAAVFSSLGPISAGEDRVANPQLHGPPTAFFLIFGLFLALGLAYGVLELCAARFLSHRRRRVFALVSAIPRLVFIPYGTILSVLTLIVLERPSVKQLFR